MKKPKKLNRMFNGNLRCVICDSVSSGEIVDEYDTPHKGTFYLQEDGFTVVCSECTDDLHESRAFWRDVDNDDLEDDNTNQWLRNYPEVL